MVSKQVNNHCFNTDIRLLDKSRFRGSFK